MYCPDCGTENSRNQKYCVRCGANLIVVDQARSIIQEVSTNKAVHQVNPNFVLRAATILSILGFLFTVIGTIVLTLATEHNPGPPAGLFFGFAAFTALVLIVRRILRLIEKPREERNSWMAKVMEKKASEISPPTTRSLTELQDTGYYSVTEDRTRQFERQPER